MTWVLYTYNYRSYVLRSIFENVNRNKVSFIKINEKYLPNLYSGNEILKLIINILYTKRNLNFPNQISIINNTFTTQNFVISKETSLPTSFTLNTKIKSSIYVFFKENTTALKDFILKNIHENTCRHIFILNVTYFLCFSVKQSNIN